MAETGPSPTHDPYNAPYDVWVIRTAREAIKRSRELLEETKALVEPGQHRPSQGHGKKPLQADEDKGTP
jgi:hypothetical protein